MVTTTSAQPDLIDRLPAGYAAFALDAQDVWVQTLARINLPDAPSILTDATKVLVRITDALTQTLIMGSQATAEISIERPWCLLLERRAASTDVNRTTLTHTSTAARIDDRADEKAFEQVLTSLAQKWSEDDISGMESILDDFLSHSGAAGIVALAVAAEHDRIGSLLLVDTMALLARSQSPDLYNATSWMMRKFLHHSSAAVRYAALSGLLSLEDSTTVTMLEQAVEVEPLSELREEIARGIEYLRSL